jgi:hypothetical protein
MPLASGPNKEGQYIGIDGAPARAVLLPAGTLAALFSDYPAQARTDKMSVSDRRAVKNSLAQLARQWQKYFECSNRATAQLLRETADLFDA